MRVLIHGYGLLDKHRHLVAGSKMSGLTLYNSILVEGLRGLFRTSFVCGRLSSVRTVVEKQQIAEDLTVFEYDARFTDYLEVNGIFVPELAKRWYCDRVTHCENPIYCHLMEVYSHIIKEQRPDVLNLHNLNAASAYVHLHRRTNGQIPPAIVTVHDTTQEQLAFIGHNKKRIACFVAISRAVEDELTLAGIERERATLIPNGLPLRPFFDDDGGGWNLIARREGIPIDDAFQILVPVRRVSGKGIEFAIKAFDDLFAQLGQRVRLIITGSGMADDIHEKRLRLLISELASSVSIHLCGPVSYSEMPCIYSVCGASLIPSTIREGFCYANLEAMATGKPVVVATNHGGCLDYLIHGVNSLLIPPANQNAIVNMLLWVINNPLQASRLKDNARQTAAQYTEETMIKSYAFLLKKIAAGEHQHG